MEQEPGFERGHFVVMTLGVYVYGALALAGLLFVALHYGNKNAALFAIASSAAAYLAQIFGAARKFMVNTLVAVVSLACAVTSFVLLMGLR
jgi:hypothetical protein